MIRLLVVDDSALMRRLLGEALKVEGDFEVAFARDGLDALSQLQSFRPDVVTLDIHMPGLNGLETLDRIMVERPCAVVMVSAVTQDGAAETLEALALGAVDFVTKPKGAVSLRMADWAPGLIATLRAAAGARVRHSHRLAERLRLKSDGRPALKVTTPRRKVAATSVPVESGGECPGLVLVGSSTGGPPALDALLSGLPEDFPWPVLIAQHMPATFTGPLARRLDGLCALSVVEVDRPTALQSGVVYVARGDADLLVARRAKGLIALPAPASDQYRWHPSVDRLVESALHQMPADRMAGVLLTGMGNDGARAMTRLHQEGGWTVAEAEDTAVVWGMPGELARANGATVVAPLPRVSAHLVQAVMAS